MPQQADYILVVSDHEDHLNGFHYFAEMVNRKLKAGYLLHGPPFHIGHVLYQAMIKPGTVAGGQEQVAYEFSSRNASAAPTPTPAGKTHSSGKN